MPKLEGGQLAGEDDTIGWQGDIEQIEERQPPRGKATINGGPTKRKKPAKPAKETKPQHRLTPRQDPLNPSQWGEELLASIFLMSVDVRKKTGSPQYPLPEVTISHVCSNWRKVALSTPSLWGFFRFDGTRAERVPEDRLEALHGGYTSDPWDEQRMVVEILTPHLNRCRHFSFIAGESAYYREFACDIEDMAVPMLQTFSTSHYSELDLDEKKVLSEWSPNIFLGGAPSLKSIALHGLSISDYRPPLDCVVDLRLDARSSPAFSVRFNSTALDSIFALPHLRALSVLGTAFKITSIPEGPAVVTQALEHFRCDDDKESNASVAMGEYFLSRVNCPHLKSLTLEGLVDTKAARRAHRYPSLEALVVRPGDEDLPFLIDIFSQAPNLRQLILLSGWWFQSDTNDVPLARALTESRPTSSVQEVIINAGLSDPAGAREVLTSAFPKLSALRVRKEYVKSLRTGAPEAPVRIKSLGPPTKAPRDNWPSYLSAKYRDWGRFDFQYL